jgi:hypothetical protein
MAARDDGPIIACLFGGGAAKLLEQEKSYILIYYLFLILWLGRKI